MPDQSRPLVTGVCSRRRRRVNRSWPRLQLLDELWLAHTLLHRGHALRLAVARGGAVARSGEVLCRQGIAVAEPRAVYDLLRRPPVRGLLLQQTVKQLHERGAEGSGIDDLFGAEPQHAQ